jgi:hypothetical protein
MSNCAASNEGMAEHRCSVLPTAVACLLKETLPLDLYGLHAEDHGSAKSKLAERRGRKATGLTEFVPRQRGCHEGRDAIAAVQLPQIEHRFDLQYLWRP